MSIKEFLVMVLGKVRSKVMEEFDELPLGILDLHKSRVVSFDLENGEVEFDLHLPIPVDNFDELMRFTVQKYTAKLKKMADKYFPRRDICLWDLYYKLPHMSWSVNKDWVPPYDGKVHSFISSFRIIFTF